MSEGTYLERYKWKLAEFHNNKNLHQVLEALLKAYYEVMGENLYPTSDLILTQCEGEEGLENARIFYSCLNEGANELYDILKNYERKGLEVKPGYYPEQIEAGAAKPDYVEIKFMQRVKFFDEEVAEIKERLEKAVENVESGRKHIPDLTSFLKEFILSIEPNAEITDNYRDGKGNNLEIKVDDSSPLIDCFDRVLSYDQQKSMGRADIASVMLRTKGAVPGHFEIKFRNNVLENEQFENLKIALEEAKEKFCKSWQQKEFERKAAKQNQTNEKQ